ncbi:MAG: response regulator [Hyphomicrobiales bacterium]|nr:response regulator [Hyphomicrobiales bacterium]
MSPRILLVEDDLISQDVLKSVLEARGFVVDAAKDGFAAVRLLEKRGYDLALVDYQLPDMDGYASARLIRDLHEKGGPKLIALTANAPALEARTGADEIFEMILPKSLDLPSLLQAIDRSLSDPRRGSLIRQAIGLWQERGHSRRPPAIVFPEPTREQHLVLGVCFDLVPHDPTEVILVTDSSVIPSLEQIRASSQHFLLPIVDLSGCMAESADVTFSVSAPDSWSGLAACIDRHASRSTLLNDHFRHAAKLEDRLIAYLFVAERSLAPIVDASKTSCVRYSGCFPDPEVIDAAENLVSRGLLVRDFFDRFHSCINCHSHRLNVREECPSCRSPYLNLSDLLHHFKCAHQGPEEEFRSGSRLLCPKCRKELRHYGGDYDKSGRVLRCSPCGTCSSEPAIGFSCMDCGTHMDGDATPKRDLFAYHMTPRARQTVTRSLVDAPDRLTGARGLLRPAVTRALEKLETDRRKARSEFEVIEISYKARDDIIARHGLSHFMALRALFIENLINKLSDLGEVLAEGDKDYAVVEKREDASFARIADRLLLHCQSSLAINVDPAFRVLDAKANEADRG